MKQALNSIQLKHIPSFMHCEVFRSVSNSLSNDFENLEWLSSAQKAFSPTDLFNGYSICEIFSNTTAFRISLMYLKESAKMVFHNYNDKIVAQSNNLLFPIE